MHAPEPKIDQHRTASQDRPACSYSLESLMALQKILENGFPEGEPLPCPSQFSTAASSAQTSPRVPVAAPLGRVARDWRQSLRLLFMKFAWFREADKGNAHHTV